MSGGRRQRKLGLERETQLGLPFGDLLQAAGIGQGRGHWWGLYKNRSLGLRSLCIRSFSIIDVPRL